MESVGLHYSSGVVSASIKYNAPNGGSNSDEDEVYKTLVKDSPAMPGFLPSRLVLWATMDNVQTCAEKKGCFAKHQPGVAGCGWLQQGRNFLST